MKKYRKPAAPTLIHEDEIRGEHKKLVQLLPKKEESLRRFHPWIFSGAIARMSDSLKEGDLVNLERSMRPDALLDGHIVQGHVDQTAVCTAVEDADGSWYFTFEYEQQGDNVTVEKGSITVNGVSLTVCDSREGSFRVAIIPYTFEHTNFHNIEVGTRVNLEFDIVGKYIARLMKHYTK